MKPPKFKINESHLKKASQLGVTIAPSKVKGKKLSVFKGVNKIADIGAKGYWDYQSYLEAEKMGIFPKGTAKMKRDSYWARHSKENKSGTPGFYALHILW